MSKVHDISVQINGNIGNSFTDAFRKASGGLADFKQEARQVQRELDRLGTDFRQGRIHESQYREETEKLTRELNKLENAQNRITALSDFGTNAWSNTKAVSAMAASAAAITATATAINSINIAADFEAQMSKIQSKTQATSQEMLVLEQKSLQLGASTSLSASETAKAMDDLAASGYDVNKIIGAMPGIIAGAESSGEDLSIVTSVVTSAISAYAMRAEEASRVSDIMAMAANNSKASVSDLGYSFKYAAPIAKTLGIRIEELTAATGILVDKGQQGEQAGTALRMALTRLSDPPKEAQKALNKLGITAVDANDNFKSLAQISSEWTKATKDLTSAQKVQYASTVFGTEASTAMLALFDAGPETIIEMTSALEKSAGAAEKASKVMKDNFSGAKEEMFGSFESAQIAFATPILPVLQDTFNGISSLIEDNMDTIENAGKAVAVVLEDITAPFSTEKPIKPTITPNMDPTDAQNAIKQYYKDLEQYEMFSGMDMSEKVTYMLDETVDAMDTWLQGEGGEAVDSIFKELGTLAGKAWLQSFTTSATASIENIAEGNIVGGVALAAAANMMTGGLLVKGGVSAGKWAVDKGKDIYSNRKSNKATVVDNPTNSKKDNTKNPKSSEPEKTVVNKNSKSTKASASSTPNSKNSLLKDFGKYGKTAGKVFVPLSLAASAVDIMTADDKSKAISSAVGSGLGGWGGAAAGAAIGSAILPGIGTVAGGLIGGFAGGSIGNSIGEWFNGLFDGKKQPTTATATASPTSTSKNAASVDLTALNAEVKRTTSNAALLTQYLGQASGMVYGSFYPLQEKTNMAGNNMSLLVSYAGQASGFLYGSFYPLYEKTNTATHNMGLLASYVGQASGWIYSLSNIQTAGQRVVSALNNLEERINNVQLPGGAQSRRVSYDS